MRRRLRSNNTNLIKLAMLGVVAMASGFFLTSFLGSKSATQALSATEFQAGRIIDDSIFYNPNTMTAAEIDAFIDSHSPACDMWGTQKVYGNVTRAEYVKQLRAQGYTKYHDPPFVCVSEYYENPETHKTNFETGGKKEAGMLSAGEIIYRAAHEYSINPQVLLVMLKKESYVWGDDWPHSFQYNTVMGYACPDGAPCDSKYFGFYNQVMMAAWQLNYYRDHIYSYNYRPYTTNQILYNPDRSCGSKSVYLENIATTSLYIYTPYVPNDGALANYPGTSYCGSYGNRNFYMYFREWFGSTLSDYTFLTDDLSDIYVIKNPGNHTAITDDSGNVVVSPVINGSQSQEWSLIRDPSTGYYEIKNQSTGKTLSIANHSPKNKANVVTESYTGDQSQKWILGKNSSGNILIFSASNTRYVLDLQDGKNNIQTYEFINNNSHQYWILDAPEPKTDTIDDTKSYFIKNPSNNSFLGSSSKGNIQTSPNQQSWHFVESEDKNYYTIVNPKSDEVLGIDNSSFSNKSNVRLGSNTNTCAQKWIIRSLGRNEYQIKNACYPKFVLDLQDGLSNVQIYTKTSYANAHQKWIIEESTQEPKLSVVDESKEYRIVNPENNSALSFSNSNVLTKSKNNSDPSQTWILTKGNNDYYTITNKASQTALDISGGNFANKTSIQLHSSNGSCAQKWDLQKNSDGSFTIASYCSNLFVLDLQDGLSNVQIYTKTSYANAHQKWIIEESTH